MTDRHRSGRADTTAILESFLSSHLPVAIDDIEWADAEINLVLRTYVTTDDVPEELVTSARAIIVSDASVLLMQNDEEMHILPGGRREPGEPVRAAAEREVGEETGLRIALGPQIGVLVYEHRTRRPADYGYPYPIFLQVVYVGMVGEESVLGVVADDWERSARWVAVDTVEHLGLPLGQCALLRAALGGGGGWVLGGGGGGYG